MHQQIFHKKINSVGMGQSEERVCPRAAEANFRLAGAIVQY